MRRKDSFRPNAQTRPSEDLRIFLSLVPKFINEQDLTNFFSKFGKVKIITLREKPSSNAPKIGILQCWDRQTQNKILIKNVYEIFPRIKIRVTKYLSGEERKVKDQENCKKKVALFGIYGFVSEKSIAKAFGKMFGKVDFCYLERYYDSKFIKSHGFAAFFDVEAAKRAVKVKMVRVTGKKVRIKEFKAKNQRKIRNQNRGEERENSHFFSETNGEENLSFSNRNEKFMGKSENFGFDNFFEGNQKCNRNLNRFENFGGNFQGNQFLRDISINAGAVCFDSKNFEKDRNFELGQWNKDIVNERRLGFEFNPEALVGDWSTFYSAVKISERCRKNHSFKNLKFSR